MITIQEGSEHMPNSPWVKAELWPDAHRFFGWLFEVFYYDWKEKCWVHYWQKDDGAWLFRNAWKRATQTVEDVWFELYEEQKALDKKV